MEKKINIAELLKDCPNGIELDCINYDGIVTFEGIIDCPNYPIKISVKYDNEYFTETLTKYGQTCRSPYNKCVIYPKGKTTWEGFQRPFKDGDIITTLVKKDYLFYSIYKNREDKKIITYIDYCRNSDRIFDYNAVLCFANDITEQRLSTEEEKQKLFDAIKANGYKWNEENKTLEKLVEPIEDKGNISDGYHTFNELYEYRLLYNASMFNELAKQGLYDVHKSKRHSDGTIPFGDENWFIVQAELPTGQISNHYEMKDWELFNIPEKEKANHYDGHTPQDVAKRMRDFLSLKKYIVPKFKVGDKVRHKDDKTVITITGIKDDYYFIQFYNIKRSDYQNEKVSFKDQDQYELVHNKFDINTLKPFDKVLVRSGNYQIWKANMFSSYCRENIHPFSCVSGYVSQCIPYEENKHLLGSTDECDEFYKNWK